MSAAERLIADGNYELAAELLAWTEARLGQRPAVERVERGVYLKLMEKDQNTNPFKYILYSGRFVVQTPQLALPASK